MTTPFPALQQRSDSLLRSQRAKAWNTPKLKRQLDELEQSVSLLGGTIALSATATASTGGQGVATDALSLGVGVSASAAASLSAGISLGIGVSASASLTAQLTVSIHAAISAVATLEGQLVAYNAEAAGKAGTNGVLPPFAKVDSGNVDSAFRGLNTKLADSQRKAYAAAPPKTITPITAELRMNRIGAWHADLEVDAEDALAGLVSFEVDGLVFTGTVVPDKSGLNGTRSRAQIVSGKGGISGDVQARSYTQSTGVKAGTIVRDILSDCGEDLSDLSDGPTLDKRLDRWHTVEGPASHALTRLADACGASWRMMRDGSVWFGEETWPEVKPDGALLDEDWSGGCLTLAAETPNLVPGTVYNGQRVEQVTHHIGSNLRTEARVNSPSSAMTKALAGVRRDIDYSREYPCEVVTQNSDGTLQLLPDDAVMKARGLDKVPIRYGIPGIKATVAKGARCHLAFAAGDPSRPFVCSWEYDPDKVTINSIFDGLQSLARVGDLVTTGGPGLVCTLTPVSLVGAPPNNAITMGMPCMISFSALPFLTPPEQIPAYGAISSGIPKFQG